jgi:hypothetical protein
MSALRRTSTDYFQQAAGGTADIFQLPETLPEEVLAKMHAPPKDSSIKTLDDPKTLGTRLQSLSYNSLVLDI